MGVTAVRRCGLMGPNMRSPMAKQLVRIPKKGVGGKREPSYPLLQGLNQVEAAPAHF